MGRISPETSALLICDIQDKFRPAIFKFDDIVSNARKLGMMQNVVLIFYCEHVLGIIFQLRLATS